MNTASTSTLASLLPAALVGTQRQTLPRSAAADEVGALLEQVATHTAEPATALLRSAGVLAVCGRAGAQGLVALSPTAACGEETRAAPTEPTWVNALAWALREGPSRLQHEALSLLALRGWRLPAALLPICLEQGRRSVALRTALMSVLDERGPWLAVQNPAWGWAGTRVQADANGVDVWTEGTLEQRREWLRAALLNTPDTARERLASSLAELPAQERSELLGELRNTLRAEDEPLLAGLLREDRSKDVRQVAQSLLLRLPGSAFVQRATQRIAPWLRYERALLRSRWSIEPPEAADPAWKDDGIDLARPKNDGLGERAGWLYQCVRQVPLPWWTEHTSMKPAQLLEWAAKSDWAVALTRAWFDVLQAAPTDDWCDAFLNGWPSTGPREDCAAVLALLPLATREGWWQKQLLGRWRSSVSFPDTLPEIMAACPPGCMLSPEFSVVLAQRAAQAMNEFTTQTANAHGLWTLRAHLPDVACLLDLPSLAALHHLPMPADAPAAHTQTLQSLNQVLQARHVLHALPTAQPRS